MHTSKNEKEITYYKENPLKFISPSDETILRAAKDEIKRYLNLKIKDRIFGKRITVSPSFIAHSIEYRSNFKLYINCGRIVGDEIERESVVKTNCLVGEGYRGGYAFDQVDTVPFSDDYRALREMIWFSTSSALMSAYSRYASKFGEISRAKREIDILSKEKKVVDIRKEIKFDDEFETNLNCIIDALMDVTRFLSFNANIADSRAKLSLNRILRYFINSEGTTIKTDSLYAFVTATGQIYDNCGEIEFKKALGARALNLINLNKILSWKDEILRTLLEMKNCKRGESGTYPVLIDGELHGVLWHEGVGHLLEKRASEDAESETFTGKIGKKIAPSFIDLECNPTLKDKYGSYEYDDEGVAGKKVTLISGGVLKNFLHSRLTAGKLGKQSNGHARAGAEETCEGKIYLPPAPRMSNLVITSRNPYSNKKIINKFIEMVEKKGRNFGLYCRGYVRGSVESESGKNELHPLEVFKFYTNGKMERIKDVYIIGTPHALINKLIACGKDLVESSGACIAESGDVRTGQIAPSAILDDVEFARESKRNERKPFLPKPK